jgi:hypothetical protein
MNTRSIAGRLTALLVAGVLLAGCGSSSSKSSSDSPSLSNASSKCLDAAKKISDSSAQKLAVQACDAIKNVNTTDLKSAVLKQCLAAAKQVPIESARKTAEDACKNGVK